ncbi:hypothetical protein [uncultured Methylobacterium sp.]|uniref:hypothetical protein n=1 Tax=uncultured Methylobacterium sp. TaxID=157278 RepID=UPI0035CC2586
MPNVHAMKAMLAAATLLAALVPAAAQTRIIAQSGRANVFGLVEVGGRGPLVVSQTGQANMAGIVQVAPDARLSIVQSGRAGTAFVGQFQGAPSLVGQRRMP